MRIALARRRVVQPFGARDAGLEVFGLRPEQLAAGNERALRVDAVEHRAREAAAALDAEGAAEREQPLGERNDGRVARGARIFEQQPHPFELMAGLAQAPFLAGRDRPVLREELDQRAGLRIDEAPLEQIDQRARAAQPVLLRGRRMQREHGFEQMHVRVLPARQLHARAARRELLEEAAVERIGQPVLHELPGRVGELDRALSPVARQYQASANSTKAWS